MFLSRNPTNDMTATQKRRLDRDDFADRIAERRAGRPLDPVTPRAATLALLGATAIYSSTFRQRRYRSFGSSALSFAIATLLAASYGLIRDGAAALLMASQTRHVLIEPMTVTLAANSSGRAESGTWRDERGHRRRPGCQRGLGPRHGRRQYSEHVQRGPRRRSSCGLGLGARVGTLEIADYSLTRT